DLSAWLHRDDEGRQQDGRRLARIRAADASPADRPLARVRRYPDRQGSCQVHPGALADRRARLLAIERQPPADDARARGPRSEEARWLLPEMVDVRRLL